VNRIQLNELVAVGGEHAVTVLAVQAELAGHPVGQAADPVEVSAEGALVANPFVRHVDEADLVGEALGPRCDEPGTHQLFHGPSPTLRCSATESMVGSTLTVL